MQPDVESSFRQPKDPHVVSFSPMHHWTEHKIRVHAFYCVLAQQIAHLMRRHAHHDGHQLSVRGLLDELTQASQKPCCSTKPTAPAACSPT